MNNIFKTKLYIIKYNNYYYCAVKKWWWPRARGLYEYADSVYEDTVLVGKAYTTLQAAVERLEKHWAHLNNKLLKVYSIET